MFFILDLKNGRIEECVQRILIRRLSTKQLISSVTIFVPVFVLKGGHFEHMM